MSINCPVISIIIVNYNGKRFLETSIPSILNQTFKDYEIILVDNGSSDDSIEYISSHYHQIKIITNQKNSFSAGNNAGIRQAKGSYFFIVNNDVELERNCLQELMAAIKKSKANVGMWATKILNFYNRKIIDNTGLLIYQDGLSRGRGRLETDRGQYQEIDEVCFPSGCAALYKREVINEIGLLDDDFIFFSEDVDLGLRIRLAGWTCLYVPRAIVYHMYSATSGRYSPQKAFLAERNRFWVAVKIFPLGLLLLNPYYSLKRYLYQIYGILTKRGSADKFIKEFSKVKLIIILFKAWFAALAGLPKMLKKRQIIQKNKKVSKKEIYSWFKKFGISARELALKD